MLKIVAFCLLLDVALVVNGHKNIQKNEADLQAALIPQELNPSFVSDQDAPWRAVLPLPRLRRNVDFLDTSSTITYRLKQYSRSVACVVLVISAVIEIVLYLIDFYNTV